MGCETEAGNDGMRWPHGAGSVDQVHEKGRFGDSGSCRS